jgi:hypothetical protein
MTDDELTVLVAGMLMAAEGADETGAFAAGECVHVARVLVNHVLHLTPTDDQPDPGLN